MMDMIRRSFTAVIEKNSRFTAPFQTEPYEAGWAAEARWFIKVIDLTGELKITAQISPDGIVWCDEGDATLAVKTPGLYSVSLHNFGNWLRLHADLGGADCSAKVMIYLVLKE
jgi:hypothetical protein